MPIHNAALDRWLLSQAVAWTVLIPTLAWWIEVAGAQPEQFLVWGGAVLLGHVLLLRALGAGATIADKVTLGRGIALLVCAGLAWSAASVSWWLWVGLFLAVLADLLDGWCARRYGGSEAGAMLDMETDQATTLCLAFLLHAVAGVGPWVYLVPGYRYGYILLLRSLRVGAADPKPCDGDNRRARLICALMMVLLLAGVAPFCGPVAASVCAAIPVLLLAYSYGSDVSFLLRRRREGRAG